MGNAEEESLYHCLFVVIQHWLMAIMLRVLVVDLLVLLFLAQQFRESLSQSEWSVAECVRLCEYSGQIDSEACEDQWREVVTWYLVIISVIVRDIVLELTHLRNAKVNSLTRVELLPATHSAVVRAML